MLVSPASAETPVLSDFPTPKACCCCEIDAESYHDTDSPSRCDACNEVVLELSSGDPEQAAQLDQLLLARPQPGFLMGNRCGHDPQNPAWHLFNVPYTQKDNPHVQQKLLEGSMEYFFIPETLPTLHNLSGKTNKDGTPRSNRSEAREAESLVLAAILHRLDFSSLRVGTPLPNGGFVPRSFDELAQIAGLAVWDKEHQKWVASKRFSRAVRRLKLAGAFSVHKITVKRPDGSYCARPAIKRVNENFLIALGKVGVAAFKSFRKWCSAKIGKARKAHRKKHPEQTDFDKAREQLRLSQMIEDCFNFKKKPSSLKPDLPDENPECERRRQYSLAKVAHVAERLKTATEKLLRPEVQLSESQLDILRRSAASSFPSFETWLSQLTS